MKILVIEYVTGGGLYRQPLPPSLASEGELMLRSLLADLAENPAIRLCATRDSRLPDLPPGIEQWPVSSEDDPWQLWQDRMAEVDAVWPIAPESGVALSRLTQLIEDSGKYLLGSTVSAVNLAGSKRATAACLMNAGVRAVRTCLPVEVDWQTGPWVAKPDDGAGCEDTRYFDNLPSLMRWLEQDGRAVTHVVQPYLAGVAMSLSMLCRDGNAWLLSANRQLVELQDGVFNYHGSQVNIPIANRTRLELLAQAVAQAIPGLAGYAGIDLVMAEDGTMTVLEINPRLTTSYVALHRAIGVNPALCVVDLLYNQASIGSFTLAQNMVDVTLHG